MQLPVGSQHGWSEKRRREVRLNDGRILEVVVRLRPKVSPKYRVVAAMGGFADVEIWTMRECKSLQYAISTSWLHSAPAEWIHTNPEA